MRRDKSITLLLTIIALLLAANLFASSFRDSAEAQGAKTKIQYELIVQGRARNDTSELLNKLAAQGWRVRGFAMDDYQHHFLLER